MRSEPGGCSLSADLLECGTQPVAVVEGHPGCFPELGQEGVHGPRVAKLSQRLDGGGLELSILVTEGCDQGLDGPLVAGVGEGTRGCCTLLRIVTREDAEKRFSRLCSNSRVAVFQSPRETGHIAFLEQLLHVRWSEHGFATNATFTKGGVKGCGRRSCVEELKQPSHPTERNRARSAPRREQGFPFLSPAQRMLGACSSPIFGG